MKILPILTLLFLVFFIALPAVVSADITIPNPISGDMTALLTRIATAVGTIITSAGAILIVYAGVLFATSSGDSSKLSKAKTVLIYAGIGIIIGVCASGIATLVQDSFSGI